jgi:hypothetical protein
MSQLLSCNVEGTGILMVIVKGRSEFKRFQKVVTLFIFNIAKFSLPLIKEKSYFCFTDEYEEFQFQHNYT